MTTSRKSVLVINFINETEIEDENFLFKFKIKTVYGVHNVSRK